MTDVLQPETGDAAEIEARSEARVAFDRGDYALAKTRLESEDVNSDTAFLKTALQWDRALLITPIILLGVWLYAALSV